MFRSRNQVPRVPLHQRVDVQVTEPNSSSSSASTCRCSGHGTKFLELIYVNLQMFRSRNQVPRPPLHQFVDVQVTEPSSSSSSTSNCGCSGLRTEFLELLYINLQMFRPRNQFSRAPLHQIVDVQATERSSSSSSTSRCRWSGHGMEFLELLYINM